MTLKSHTRKAIPYSIAISVFNTLVALFGMVFLVRYLDGEEYGVLVIITGLPLLFNLFISLGYDAYIIRYIPNIQDKLLIGDKIWKIVFQRTVLAAIISITLVGLFNYYAEPFGLADYYFAFVIYQLSVVCHVVYTNLITALNAKFLQKYVLFLSVIHQLIRVGTILLGVFQQEQFDFFIVGFTLATALSTILACTLFSIRFKLPEFKELLKLSNETSEEKNYRRISYINSMGTSFLGTDIDRYMLGYFSTNTQVAVYAIATRVLRQLMFFYPHQMFKSVLEPAFYNKYDESSKKSDLNRMFQFLFNANSIVGFLFIAIFYPLGERLLVLVFDQDYVLEAYWPLLIFLFFIVFYAIPLGLVAKAIKRPEILLYSKLSVILNVAVGIPFSYHYGALGMAIATSLSVVLKNIIIFVMSSRLVTIHIPLRATFRSVINALTTLLIIYLMDYFWEGLLLVKILLGVLFYIAMLKLNPVFSIDQQKLFVSLLPASLKKIGRLLL